MFIYSEILGHLAKIERRIVAKAKKNPLKVEYLRARQSLTVSKQTHHSCLSLRLHAIHFVFTKSTAHILLENPYPKSPKEFEL